MGSLLLLLDAHDGSDQRRERHMAGEKRRVTEEELSWQARNIAEQIKASCPEGVGFAVLFYFDGRGKETPVAFASNAQTARSKQELQAILREFANHQGGIVLLS
jgi:hypothetical protein